jgi:hypothetical protein
MNQDDDLPHYNFDYYDWILLRIIRKYYPDLKNEKELSLLICIGWTMKDFDWTVALALEVQARMTKNPTLGESNDYEPGYTTSRTNLLLPQEYIDILSHLISAKIVQQQVILTKYGSHPRQRLEYDEYLMFTNKDMTNEILANSEALDFAARYFVTLMDDGKKSNYKNLIEK